jgi:hypothetical protein
MERGVDGLTGVRGVARLGLMDVGKRTSSCVASRASAKGSATMVTAGGVASYAAWTSMREGSTRRLGARECDAPVKSVTRGCLMTGRESTSAV